MVVLFRGKCGFFKKNQNISFVIKTFSRWLLGNRVHAVEVDRCGRRMANGDVVEGNLQWDVTSCVAVSVQSGQTHASERNRIPSAITWATNPINNKKTSTWVSLCHVIFTFVPFHCFVDATNWFESECSAWDSRECVSAHSTMCLRWIRVTCVLYFILVWGRSGRPSIWFNEPIRRLGRMAHSNWWRLSARPLKTTTQWNRIESKR